MKNKFCIRKLIEEDIEAVTLLYASVLDPSYISFSEIGEGKAISPNTLSKNADDIFRKQLLSLIHSPDHGFFVIHENDRIIGFALASLNTTEAGYIECWLDDICVAKEQQNKGHNIMPMNVANSLLQTDCTIFDKIPQFFLCFRRHTRYL